MSVLLKMEEIIRARKIFQIQNIFFIQRRQASLKKLKNGEQALLGRAVSKKIEREKKALFGPLVESLPEKRKRFELLERNHGINREDQGIEKRRSKSYKKVELEFLVKTANKKDLHIHSSSSNSTQQLKNKNLIYNLVNKPESRCYEYSLQKNEKLLENTDTKKSTTISLEVENSKNEIDTKGKILETNDDNIKAQVNSNATAPSPIVIQNMLSFSLYDSTKSGRIANNMLPVNKKIISLSVNADISNKYLPSVTRILSATMSEAAKKALAIWKAKMIEKLGQDGFNEYQQDLFKDGHDLHSSIENALLQKEYQIPEKVKPAFESVQNVLKDISSVSALETQVVHPKLLYKGVTDCVATYRGELCLIDWKKSDKRKDTIESIYDAPMQVASYIGAINADLNYPFEVKKGVVVVAYTDGKEATVHEIDQENLAIYWKAWLKRLQRYFVDERKIVN